MVSFIILQLVEECIQKISPVHNKKQLHVLWKYRLKDRKSRDNRYDIKIIDILI